MQAFSEPLGYRRSAPIMRPKLDGFTDVIDSWLDADKEVHRKQRHKPSGSLSGSGKSVGLPAGYTIIKDYVREHERCSREMFEPLAHHVNILEMNGESYWLAQSWARKTSAGC